MSPDSRIQFMPTNGWRRVKDMKLYWHMWPRYDSIEECQKPIKDWGRGPGDIRIWLVTEAKILWSIEVEQRDESI